MTLNIWKDEIASCDRQINIPGFTIWYGIDTRDTACQSIIMGEYRNVIGNFKETNLISRNESKISVYKIAGDNYSCSINLRKTRLETNAIALITERYEWTRIIVVAVGYGKTRLVTERHDWWRLQQLVFHDFCLYTTTVRVPFLKVLRYRWPNYPNVHMVRLFCIKTLEGFTYTKERVNAIWAGPYVKGVSCRRFVVG